MPRPDLGGRIEEQAPAGPRPLNHTDRNQTWALLGFITAPAAARSGIMGPGNSSRLSSSLCMTLIVLVLWAWLYPEPQVLAMAH
jgi:hypothetical protein